jgi:hypothetical protein
MMIEMSTTQHVCMHHTATEASILSRTSLAFMALINEVGIVSMSVMQNRHSRLKLACFIWCIPNHI